ncbi:AAA family ATPase [Devosia sediminis]|uniref:AAA family ATPase n=1 Tax=Devosia sediminis TaxID=2798801 RepID=A0A934IW99_9HYPH|nr:AAA family ATPase [Devosia sediminis]MBJ3783477.1 AAA family ATPase [Devosia sediminis]
MNKILKKDAGKFCERLFAFRGFEKTELSIEPEALSVGHVASISTVQARGNSSTDTRRFSLVAANGFPLYEIIMSSNTNVDFWRRYVFSAILEFTLFGGRYATFDGVYLPAARTGLVLAHRALTTRGASGLLPQENTPKLSRPLASFVENFARSYSGQDQHNIADWVQDQIFEGEVVANPVTAELHYKANNGEVVPLHATSSMITELAPFIMMLKADRLFDRLVFEEPEAHLHLSAQRTMARAVARLVNSGVQVTVTTHSDTFLQQLNNLIQMHNHPNKENMMQENGYSPEDLINPEFAKAYEFTSSNHETLVASAPLTTNGFAVATLNDVLIDLSSETLRLQD